MTSGFLYIYEQAFAGCTNIASITIPPGIKWLSPGIFTNWTASQTINMPFNEAFISNRYGREWLEGCKAVINYQE